METYVQTTSLVNYNKGVFSLYFVSQNQQQMAKGIAAKNDNELELKQVIHMPASGFMYMVSMVKNMLEDPRMQQEIENMINASLLPNGGNEDGDEESNDEGHLVIKSNGEKNKK
ncbi:peptide chain release factor 1 [Yersinia enterocolitica]|uniref:peptide chain release factor 1 n=1 Tax=Yersinia enterocolitica TaxID=630 RepID=UPI00155B0546|nr:peptide chain release factor 1 [Yersinia enterocolitica]MBX9482742.1 peptide chain release factor 1 [Yersinia enterocolitica]NQS95778.1 peptide chain release factor 1 [Yersinia enterocolitica]NQT44726.1 peptide chain release factor 1 [Yersinia enterocolitica]NQT99215.1 peptide chain release factor 1 [Yersinia enterocolitica]HDM8447973.1 peptide chain release factor 1 [Yersinia enterocolitica]